MSLFTKGYRFVFGFVVFLLYHRKLDFNYLVRGKRIAIVGAANSAYNTGKGSYIDGFDFVVRINKAPYLVESGKWKEDIGSKTDVLFHSFFENQESGGGPMNLGLYDTIGIRYLVNPVSNFAGYRLIFNFYKKYLARRITYSLSQEWFKAIERQLGTFRPTIGFCALSAAVQSDFSELYITGFTFFKTAFGEGYRDQMKESHQVLKFIKDSGLHNPDLEFEEFLKLLDCNKGKNIILDETLKAIVTSASK
jgi:hypothetical protein